MTNNLKDWERDEHALRTFCETAEDASKRRGVKDNTMRSRATISITPGTSTISTDVGDEDHMRALMAPLRQLLLEQDDQSFNRVANVLAVRLTKDSELWKAGIDNRGEWKKALSTSTAGIVAKGGHHRTHREMFDLVAYSGVFHTSIDTRAEWKALHEVERGMILVQIPPLLIRLTRIAMAQRAVILEAFDTDAFDTDGSP